MSDNNDNILSCANCGNGEEESINLKYCGACKLVKYCSAECQKVHRPMHKKECKKRAAELYEEALFKEHAPTEDCPICMIPLPLDERQSAFYRCCGKTICCGCIFGMYIESISKDKKDESPVCPYCRMKFSRGEVGVKQLQKLIDNGNAEACFELSRLYTTGKELPQDMEKAYEFLFKGCKLGCGKSCHNLAVAHQDGAYFERDERKAKYYYELAVINGSICSRSVIGNIEGCAGNEDRAKRHILVGARAGDKKSLDLAKEGYKHGLITKDEYANTLRAYQKRHDEMKSDNREKARRITAPMDLH